MALSVTTVGIFMASLDCKHRGDRTPHDFTEFTRQYRSRNMDYYRLCSDDDDTPVMLGRLADLYGRVRLYNLGFTIFTVGSLFCALSETGEQLVMFRFLQGAGAALLMANSVAIITDAFPKEELGMGTWDKHYGGEPGSNCGLYSQRRDDNLFWMAVNIPY